MYIISLYFNFISVYQYYNIIYLYIIHTSVFLIDQSNYFQAVSPRPRKFFQRQCWKLFCITSYTHVLCILYFTFFIKLLFCHTTIIIITVIISVVFQRLAYLCKYNIVYLYQSNEPWNPCFEVYDSGGNGVVLKKSGSIIMWSMHARHVRECRIRKIWKSTS